MDGTGGIRPFRPLGSVRVRLLTGLLIVATLGMSAGGAVTFLIQRERILSAVDSTLLARVAEARSVALGASNSKPTDPNSEATTPQPFRSGNAALEAIISRVLPDAHEDSLGILDGNARFVPGVATDFHLEKVPGIVPRIVREVADGKVHLGTTTSGSGALRYVAAPITVSGSNDRGIYVTATSLNAELSDLASAFTTYWEVIAGAVVVIAAFGWFIAGRLLRPIRELRLAAERITSSNRAERIPVAGRDDLSHLTMTVNDMLDRLDSALTGQRQLLDDVRHELNTPITIVRGHLELLDPADMEEVSTVRALAIDELDRVTALVQDLALLAETERAEPVRVLVDVADLCEQVFAKVSVLPGHTWKLEETVQATIAIDSGRITQAWLQLVDNAGKYSPVGSEIQLGTRQQGDNIEFWVANSGQEIPLDSRARIFERFGRADADRGIVGSGLGLPIVQAIAVAHGGRVGLESSDQLTRFAIVLPQHPGTVTNTPEVDFQ